MTHELTRDIVMIGRAPLNQIVIDDPTVSAQHALLLRTGDSYSLKDLNSTNGTQVNVFDRPQGVFKFALAAGISMIISPALE